jgi:asparagine synthase (glutamine-hydrolysing)
VASELKALEGYCTKIQLFPGHYMTSKDGEFVQWYKENGLIMML